MLRFVELIKRFNRNEEGQDLVEYAMLVALIAIVVAVGVAAFGVSLNAFFSNLYSNIPLG
jgi:Flp pilus assembly pilin Flp